MDTASLMALSPLDGRYHEKVSSLRAIFSEYGLIRFRVMVEIRWIELLSEFGNLPEIPSLSAHAKQILNDIIDNFSLQDALRVKHIESGINHDVKAVEYFIKEKIGGNEELGAISEFIHFGCTSEDINNLSYGLMLQTARKQCILPALDDLLLLLRRFAHEHAHVPMLSRTHGQPATPTTVGKEIANIIARLQRQVDQLNNVQVLGKINGASGNYNAFVIAYPEADWQCLSKNFVTRLGLDWNAYTTQIEPHDCMAEFFAVMVRINNIILDFNRDTWGYIALNYFRQKSFSNEVGSSTMPHKVNPIDFENSEGNLGIANALYEHMIAKLPVSRWQRDLSDSTVLRNIGVAVGHSLLAYQSTSKGLEKLTPNLDVITADLDRHWEVLAEAVQTVMRRFKLEQPYEKLKSFTRGKRIDKISLQQFIADLPLPENAKKQLLELTPGEYIGYAEELASRI
ncbi:Adenylosuccinate lyase [Aquicella siphonis]|uniref:Adenylosuccinate lyase n=1 Tax=Aquicella siphonis TaxID=254247 RepID=A0A5E4PIH6_9COXI|nr:adenylosuccinate lyase [Aquicella siphonis]VVC76161.1 Adenylosuccinate lyase [Aquicella siphonis]